MALRERWPFSAVAAASAPGRQRVASTLANEAAGKTLTESQMKNRVGKDRGESGAEGGRGRVAGGWRVPVSTAAAVGATTDESKVAEMQRERWGGVLTSL